MMNERNKQDKNEMSPEELQNRLNDVDAHLGGLVFRVRKTGPPKRKRLRSC